MSAARRVSIVANYISDNTLQAIDLSPDGVMIIDLDSERPLAFNPAAARRVQNVLKVLLKK